MKAVLWEQRGIHHRVRQEDNVVIDMETKFNFNSQICTTKEQSERLLALGIKKETADMYLCPSVDGIIYQVVQLPESSFAEDETPAWSLHRLCELLGKIKKYEGEDELLYPQISL